jgi:microcystin-dependent protein
MVGTIYGLGLSQQFQADGEPEVGCLLYLYEAGTSTPVTAYSDFGLTTGNERPWPMVADAVGRIPAFWLADGSYRVRLTDADGNELFDESSITAIGASAGTPAGGGTSTESVLAVGDMIFTFGEGARSGMVRCNGGSIGSSSSGATERANSDTEALFSFLWNNVSDSYAAVSGGRGASAASDWTANKRIDTPSMQGRVPAGLDGMGRTAAGILSGITDPGETGGAETLTIAEANIPSHTHAVGSLVVDSHSHSAGTYAVGSHTHDAGSLACPPHTHDIGKEDIADPGAGAGLGAINAAAEDGYGTSELSASVTITGASAATAPTFSGSSGSASPGITGATAATGSGTAVTITQPYRAGTWYIKL